ncbi:XRE family transcriptional regulator [Variovorax sp. J22R133]|uniref:helix-turn-helix domain-containing protein n=1 Tax=Variovorax brevis TaxID=3053503 RepID=UPI002576037B|nr:XRE family transcriptional regulator [Variovorax sp. J22R133]MDM0111264.1 XRE family transcriptional regulator [Variovorax sp. J22R133]
MSNIVRKSPPRDDVLAHVASNVRRLRQAAGLSQAVLADAAGLSRRMVVNLEGGDTNISLSSLDRLAIALDVKFVDIVSDPQRQPQRIEAVAWRGIHADSHATLLGSASARRDVELWIWSLAKGERYETDPDPQGWQEMVYVIEGRLQVTLAEGARTIGAGDFAIYSSAQPYGYVALGGPVTRFIRNVVT